MNFFDLTHKVTNYLFNRFITGQHNDARLQATPPKVNACSQKSGNVANVRTSRQGAKNLQFLSGCNF